MAQLPQNNNGPNGGHLLIEPVQRPHIVYPGSDPKPVVGVHGRKIRVDANVYALRFNENMELGTLWYQWAVTILDDRQTTRQGLPPPVPPKSILRQIWRALEEGALTGGNPIHSALGGVAPVYDGRSLCYTATMLPMQNITVAVTIPGQKSGFNVTISNPTVLQVDELKKWYKAKAAAQADANGCLAALNTLFHHGFALLYPSNKTTFFINNPQHLNLKPQGNAPFGLPKGIELWRGFFESVRTSSGGLLLNIDTTTGAFVKSGSLRGFLGDYLGTQAPNRLFATAIPPVEFIRMNRVLKGGVIDVDLGRNQQPMRGLKIRLGLSRESAKTASFDVRGGGRTTVQEYFSSHYGIVLNEPDLPCVEVKAGVLYPLELCSLKAGHKSNRKLSAEQQLQATAYQQLKPADRLSSIMTIRESAIVNVTTPNLAPFQIAIAPKPRSLEARVLFPPEIQYARNSTSQVQTGAWKMMKGRQQFIQGAQLRSFGIIVLNDRDSNPTMNWLSAFFPSAAGLGMSFPRLPPRASDLVHVYDHRGDMRGNLATTIDQAQRCFGTPPELVFFIFAPRVMDARYAEFKREGMSLGIATQALRADKLQKTNDFQLFINVAMKINGKLGGRNFTFAPNSTDGGDARGQRKAGWLERAAPLVFAADLTHAEEKPSIAVVVASCDKGALTYQAKIAVQPLAEPAPGSTSTRGRKKEVVEGIHDMVLSLLKDRFAVTQQIPPKSVLFYRDGVSDSEWAALLTIEIPEIKRAFETFKREQPACANWQPQLTHIVTVKRHHIRLFPSKEDRNASEGRQGNVPAGTVADQGVVDARAFDWYGVAHAGILGTSRPTRFIVMTDEARLTPDDLQSATNSLCHAYARCNRAVSLPAPVYYADAICTRVRSWMPTDDGHGSVGGATASSGSGDAQSRAIDFSSYEHALAWVATGLDSFRGAPGRLPTMWWL